LGKLAEDLISLHPFDKLERSLHMKIFWTTLLACFLMGAPVLAAEPLTFDNYIKSFDYRERSNMKIGILEMLNLYKQGQVQIIDIRFPEEYQVYRFGFIKNIPLNEQKPSSTTRNHRPPLDISQTSFICIR
jgi:hypothetical protein